MNELDWVDLPNDNYAAILGYETENTVQLDSLIRRYNEIPKDRIETLSCRIRKLGKIIDLIKEWTENRLESVDKKKHLLWISEMAAKKQGYLDALLQIYETKLHEETGLEAYHIDLFSFQDRSKTPVFLNNHRFYSLKMREYWGDFWMEAIDPCHRRLTPYLEQWEGLKKTNPEIPHFFLWLETQNLPKYVPRVTYLKEDDLEKKRLLVRNSLFCKRTDIGWAHANFDDPVKRYLFSIDLNKEVYVAEEMGGISHSSFTSGKPVLGAGLLQMHEGLLTALALESGHYMPSMEIGHQILTIFKEKGALFPNELEIVFFHDRNKYKVKLAANPLPPLERFKEILESAYSDKLKGCYETSSV